MILLFRMVLIGSNIATEDGMAVCPVCDRSMKIEAVSRHIDKCLAEQEAKEAAERQKNTAFG